MGEPARFLDCLAPLRANLWCYAHIGNLARGDQSRRGPSGRLTPAAAASSSALLGLGYTVHLSFPADVVLEFSYQRQDTHDQFAGPRSGVDRRVIDHLEG
jgi:hypothetical protein